MPPDRGPFELLGLLLGEEVEVAESVHEGDRPGEPSMRGTLRGHERMFA